MSTSEENVDASVDNQEHVEKLKSLRAKVNWEIEEERLEFLARFNSLIVDWKGQLPDLREIFRPREIDWLIIKSLKSDPKPLLTEIAPLIEFVARSGYRDEPELDEAGKPKLSRTTALHHVARRYRFALVLRTHLFKIYNRFEANYVDEFGLTHFHVACQQGCVEAIEKFLELGQDIDVRVRETGDTALLVATRRRYVFMVEFLLRHGAAVSLANAEGVTPLHSICRFRCDRRDLARKMLEQADARVDVRDNRGDTPLHLAVSENYEGLIELLLSRGADPNQANDAGETPLHVALRSAYYRSGNIKLELLEKAGHRLRIDARDNQGRTPLQLAVANLWPDVVSALLDRGADLSGFVFPAECDFVERYERWRDAEKHSELGLASSALLICESLEKRGYELQRSDALTVMKVFAKYELFEKLPTQGKEEDPVVPWYEEEEFTRHEKEFAELVKVLPRYQPMRRSSPAATSTSLSIHELTRLKPEEASRLLNYEDYFWWWRHNQWMGAMDAKYWERCQLHLCEKLSRGFFRRWAEIIGGCEIVPENLTNRDLYQICLAATAS